LPLSAKTFNSPITHDYDPACRTRDRHDIRAARDAGETTRKSHRYKSIFSMGSSEFGQDSLFLEATHVDSDE